MNLEKLNPWNWFKHEDDNQTTQGQVPVKRNDASVVNSPSNVDSLFQLHREMDRLFDKVFNSFGMPSLRSSFPEQRLLNNESAGTYSAGTYRPQVDIAGDDKQYEITLNVPGLSSDDVSIEVQGDRLVVRGQKEEKHETNDKHYYRIERSVGSFQRTLALPEDANADEMSANLKDGVLILAIPRRRIEAKDVKKIPVSS